MEKFLIKNPKQSNGANLREEQESSPSPIPQCSQSQSPEEQSNSVEEVSVDIVSTTTSKIDRRKYLPKWNETYKWLAFDEVLNKVFCSVCREGYDLLKIPLPSSGTNDDKVYQAFVKEGFDQWRNAAARFKAHEKAEFHRKASASIVSAKTTNISKMLSEQCSQSRKDSRSSLISIFETIAFLAVQNLPIRGHDENHSNFIRLLHLRSKDNALLKAWMERSSYKWISHDIINEILSIISMDVQRTILTKIRRAPFYAVMADETTDVSRLEQMSINFRIVDDEIIINEYFLGFYDVPKTDSETLFIVLEDALMRFDLRMNKCRGQCYDGANNVSGEITGLQTRFREVDPRAVYTHCAGLNLNLAAQDGMKIIPEIADFLSNMKLLVTFCRASAKRNHIFKNIEFDDDEEDDENFTEKTAVESLKAFCPTRWTVRVKSLKSIKNSYKRVLKLCELVAMESSDSGIKARGFESDLQKFECLILLEICIATLETIEELNATIQATTITFKSIVRRVDVLKSSMTTLRSNDKFHEIWNSTIDSAKSLGLEDPVLPRQRIAPKRFDKNSKTAYFPKSPEERYRIMYFGVIDQIVSSLNTRFDSESYKILCLMEDFATQKCEIEEILPFLSHNGESDFDMGRLVLHRQMFFDYTKDQKSVLDDLTKISIFLQKNKDVRDFCCEYTKFIKLLLTAPQSVCIAERSFSSLKLLKTYVRANVKQRKTNDLALLYIHRDLVEEIDMDALVDEFICRATVRRNTFAMKIEF